jgi:hypothetical protein
MKSIDRSPNHLQSFLIVCGNGVYPDIEPYLSPCCSQHAGTVHALSLEDLHATLIVRRFSTDEIMGYCIVSQLLGRLAERDLHSMQLGRNTEKAS